VVLTITTEPDSGSYVLGMTATAVREGEGFCPERPEVHVGNSHVGDLHGVVARTGSGRRGLSAFLVEPVLPGISLAPHKPAIGLHGFSFGELIF
jgi:acyl-CoA dehydrogenase